jgi:protein-S-isoprenylcysteine O-methyltransferase Ste14
VAKLFKYSGALLFLLSLLSMPAMYLIRLREPAQHDGSAVTDAIANVALFTAFALHHSLMARTGAKAWITRFVPPDLERSVYVWIASVLFLATCLLWQPLPGVAWQVRGPGLFLYAAAAFGVALTIAGAQIVGVRELAGLAQPDPARTVAFTPKGPFGLVRHPIYLGWVLMVFSAPTMTTSRLLFAIVSTAYLVLAIPFEERSLVDAFGDHYRTYQRQVRWRLIPGVW